MRSLLLLILASCAGYQPEPYAEVRYRDEQFSDDTRHDNYYGESYHIGLRFIPPVRLADDQVLRLEAAFRDRPAPAAPAHDVTVTLPTPAPAKSQLAELGDLGKDADGNWTAWGAAVVIGLLLFGGEFIRRRRRATPPPAPR